VKHLLQLVILLLAIGLKGQSFEKKFTLHYANDAFELTQEHHQLLDSLKSLPQKDLYDIHIKGYTNNIGSEQYNLELSRKRAENVKKELRAFTIISSVGYGELESEDASNRKVEVYIHYQKDHVSVVGEVVEQPIQIEPPKIEVKFEVPRVGDKVVLEGIQFYPDQDVIMNESKPTLDKLMEFLLKYPEVKFKLIGHICCGDRQRPHLDLRNTRTGKNDLSEARARSVYNYLVKNGISKTRMRYIGMAYRNPTGKGDEFDRRVEIEITNVD